MPNKLDLYGTHGTKLIRQFVKLPCSRENHSLIDLVGRYIALNRQ
jgi:hypothetical protein